MKKVFLFLISGLVIGIVLVALLLFRGKQSEDVGTESSSLTSLDVSYSVSSIYQLELDSLAGQKILMHDYLGKPLVISFWGSWCVPCKQEMPILQSAYLENAGKIEFVGINMAESKSTVQKTVDEYGLKYTILLDSQSEAAEMMYVTAIPTTLFFDADGQLVSRHIGLMDEDQMNEYLAKLDLE